MIEKIVLIGGGGHCKSIIDSIICLNKYEIVGIVDSKENIGKNINSIPIIGEDKLLTDLYAKGIKSAFITVGSIGYCHIRERLYNFAKNIGFTIPNIIDSTSILAHSVTLGEGTFIGKGCIVNSDTTLGDMVIINSGAIIEHDCRIGNFVHIAPGVTISGNVKIGQYTHIGVGSTIIQGITIGNQTLVGASSLVLKNIDSGLKVFGIPCKEVGKWQNTFL